MFLLKCFGALSLASVRRLGAFIGRMLYRFDARTRRYIDENLKLAGLYTPTFAKRVAEETGIQSVEGLWVWQQKPEVIVNASKITGDVDVLLEHVKSKAPLILITPHIGTFEVAPIVASHVIMKNRDKVMAIMYKLPRKKALRELAGQERAIEHIAPVTADLQGLRKMLRLMKDGHWAGILPDQVPSNGQGVWAPLFGKDAYTMTLPTHLAHQFQAPIVTAVAKRVEGGWDIHLKAWDYVPTGDTQADARALNAQIEAAVALAPEQYLWAYNRYKCPRGVKRP
ncbi:MAG TPA: lipid A biosynthesis lauroyl acyltransferase [Sutterella sp.]|nr:lipid A biosynthesis lauroyl acyltransferase [Sutterella sp.]